MAALLHVAAIGWLTVPSRHDPVPVRKPDSIPVVVALVAPPEPIPLAAPEPVIADAQPAQDPQEALPADGEARPGEPLPGATSPASPQKSAEAAPAKAKRPRTIARADRPKDRAPGKPAQSEASRGNVSVAPDGGEASQQLHEEVAVYDVLVGAGGSVQAIRLARSSGISGYDEAGERMIRNTMTFAPPRSASSDDTVMVVTIRFSPEER